MQPRLIEMRPLPVVDDVELSCVYSTPATRSLNVYRWGYVRIQEHKFLLYLPSRRGFTQVFAFSDTLPPPPPL